MTPKDPLESKLKKIGESLRSEARERRPDFMAEFERRLAVEGNRAPAITSPWQAFIQWRVLAAAGAAAAALALIINFSQKPGQPVGMLAYESGAITIAGHKAETGHLSRGSVLSVIDRGNALASLDNDRIMVYMTGNSRLAVANRSNLSLESGTAWFAIRPNSGRLTVEIPEGTITVHGTAFGVRLDETGSTVFLANGSVSLATAGETLTLEPSQMAELRFGGIPQTTQLDENNTPEWVKRLHSGFQFAYNSAYFPSLLPNSKTQPSEQTTTNP